MKKEVYRQKCKLINVISGQQFGNMSSKSYKDAYPYPLAQLSSGGVNLRNDGIKHKEMKLAHVSASAKQGKLFFSSKNCIFDISKKKKKD